MKYQKATLMRPMRKYQPDLELLEEFERFLVPHAPEEGGLPCRVLGYGEISTVFEIQLDSFQGLAVKRMSVFEQDEELRDYLQAYDTYHHLLEHEVGITLPDHGYLALHSPSGRPIFYILQEKVPANSIGNNAIHLLEQRANHTLFRRVLEEMAKVWTFNQENAQFQVAIDGQISNWALAGFDTRDPDCRPDTCLLYLDTSTPIFQEHGEEQLDPELFLRAAPSFLVWIIRILFLDDVMARYYQPRKVVVDLLANLYKEGKAELIPELVETCNEVLSAKPGGQSYEPLDLQEIRSYYREDALIWSLYLHMRRVDRFLHQRLLRREYPYILPGPVSR